MPEITSRREYVSVTLKEEGGVKFIVPLTHEGGVYTCGSMSAGDMRAVADLLDELNGEDGQCDT